MPSQCRKMIENAIIFSYRWNKFSRRGGRDYLPEIAPLDAKSTYACCSHIISLLWVKIALFNSFEAERRIYASGNLVIFGSDNGLAPQIFGSDNGLSPLQCQAIIRAKYWHIINWISWGTNFSEVNLNKTIFIQENAFGNFISKVAAILSWPQCGNYIR